MSDAAMPRAAESAQPGLDLRLAALVGSRLCHDLISPLGAIGNGVELLEMSDEFPGLAKSPELTLIGESVEAARVRIRLFRLAFGHAAADQRISVGELCALIRAYVQAGRLTVDLDAEGELARSEARMIALAVMCMESAMPWGGRVLICRAAPGWRLVGDAARTRIDRGLWGWLEGWSEGQSRPDPPPAEVHFPMLGLIAVRDGRPIRWELDESGAEIVL